MNAKAGIRVSIAVLLLTALFTIPAGAAENDEAERWHVVSIADTPVGRVHETEHRGGQARVSVVDMFMALNRMGNRIEIKTIEEYRESRDGRLLAVEFTQTLSGKPTVMRAEVEGDELTVTQETGEQAFERTVALETALLGPIAARHRVAGNLHQPGDEITYDTFVPTLGKTATVRVRLDGFEDYAGERLRVVEEDIEGMPVSARRWIDEEGRALLIRMPGPFGQVTIAQADEEAAALATAGGELPEESYAATLVETGVRLPQPRRAEWLKLELAHRNPALGWPDLESNHQQVLEKTKDRLIVAVSRKSPTGGASLATDVEASSDPWLSANAWLQADDPAMRELAAEIVGDERDAWQAALRLEEWVGRHMDFDMGVVMAPSLEVLENRRGTCTEYAVLLAALARAAGIPSRFVMGYVYVHGVFAGHAWTEVRIGDEWLALDAAIPADGAADAARLAFQWSGLDDGAGVLNAGPGMQLFGQIDARVLEYRTGNGETVQYDTDLPAIAVEDNRFADRGLGVRWTGPDGARFTDTAHTWPDNRVAVMLARDGASAVLRHRSVAPWQQPLESARAALGGADAEQVRTIIVGGHQALVSRSGESAAIAVPGDGEIWSIELDGLDGEGDIDRLLEGLHLPGV